MRRASLPVSLIAAILLAPCVLAQRSSKPAPDGKAVIWIDPGNIQSRNLYWGAGGEEHRPKMPIVFAREDMGGTSPKFEVDDADDKKWSAKLGMEARPETAAARLMWAVGYVANENYFFSDLQVKNMPLALKRRRARGLLGHGEDVRNVRLQRHPSHYKRVGNWNWRHNPFIGTREFNGLRVMMGLIGNWDLKDDNNAILENEKEASPELYQVTDVGTSMGTPGKSYSDKVSKGNLHAYTRTRLIAHVHKDYIDLNFPKRPPLTELLEFEWGFFCHQMRNRWIGKRIPRADAKWIGSLLAELKPEQISDAFRAAGYSDKEVEAYTQAVISRIQELNSL